jgi:hypothetical protein
MADSEPKVAGWAEPACKELRDADLYELIMASWTW